LSCIVALAVTEIKQFRKSLLRSKLEKSPSVEKDGVGRLFIVPAEKLYMIPK
jgi:hypothetical protein